MPTPYFKYLYNSHTSLDELIEERARKIQDAHDLELEIASQSCEWTYTQIKAATAKLAAIKSHITYLDAVLDDKGA